MKHTILPALCFLMATASASLMAQPEPVITPRLPGNIVRYVDPRAARFVASLSTGWWYSRTMKDLHDTTVIPWSMQLIDIVNAARATGDTLISVRTKGHGERVVVITRNDWSYVFGERYAGGGLAFIRMSMYPTTYKYPYEYEQYVYEQVEDRPPGINRPHFIRRPQINTANENDSLSWAQVLATGSMNDGGLVTYATAGDRETTTASMSIQYVEGQHEVERLTTISIERESMAPAFLAGTAWELDIPDNGSDGIHGPFIMRFHRTERYVTAQCSGCHTTTWQYHIRGADSIQIWTGPAVCETLCISSTLPQSISDILSSTWGVIDDDTITFERNGNEVILSRIDP